MSRQILNKNMDFFFFHDSVDGYLIYGSLLTD